MATSFCVVRTVIIGMLCLIVDTPANAQTGPPRDSLVGLLVDLDRRVNNVTGVPTTDLSAIASFGNIIALEVDGAPRNVYGWDIQAVNNELRSGVLESKYYDRAQPLQRRFQLPAFGV